MIENSKENKNEHRYKKCKFMKVHWAVYFVSIKNWNFKWIFPSHSDEINNPWDYFSSQRLLLSAASDCVAALTRYEESSPVWPTAILAEGYRFATSRGLRPLHTVWGRSGYETTRTSHSKALIFIIWMIVDGREHVHRGINGDSPSIINCLF